MTTTERTKPPTAELGAPHDRVDGALKVQGQAIYAADAPVRQAAFAMLVKSTIGRGRVASIESAAARAVPGVLKVYTHENAPRLHSPQSDFAQGMAVAERLVPLQSDEVFYAGQYVAMIVAETYEAAREAAGAFVVRYEQAPPHTSIAAELPNAMHFAQSFGHELQYERGTFASAFDDADVRVDELYVTPQEHHNPMEPHATLAEWDGDRLTLHDSTQWVVGTRNVVAAMLGIERENVRVISPFLGGGFGNKGFVWYHGALTAAAARELGRPVKLTLNRDEMFGGTGHRSRTEQRIRLGAKRDGTLVAQAHDTATHTSMVGDFIESAGLVTQILYAPKSAVHVSHATVRLNLGTPVPMRAPGEAPGTFGLESAMDELAYALGMDPIELRVKNHAELDASEGKPYSSKHLLECYAEGARRFGWQTRTPQPRSMRDGEEFVGYGMATATYPANRSPAGARVWLEPSGRIGVASATHDLGTGMYTIMAQVVANRLGVEVERIDAKLGDSAFPLAPVAGGSQSTASVMPAVQAACDALLAKLRETAQAHGLPADSEWTAVVAAAGGERIEASADSQPGDETERYAFQSFGAQFAEVRYDEELGRLRVARLTGVFDAGRILNHKTARSQILGGMVWGVGMALMEEAVIDARNARIVTDNLADYHVPVNADIPPVDVHFLEYPDTAFNPLGARGVGEIGITGAAAAIANAVYHATGTRVRELPILPEKLL
jgi:xanthine dehydrogenase YagR molybdenum-binding subunit